MDKSFVLRDLSNPQEVQRLNSFLREILREAGVLYTETAPNGTISAQQGTVALYNNSGTYTTWINVDGSTTWQQLDARTTTFLELTDTPSAFTDKGGNIVAVNSGASALEFISTVIKYTDTRFKVDAFTKDVTDASGTQVITGVGFAPKAVLFIGAVGSTNNATWGVDDLTTRLVLLDFSDSAAGTYTGDASNSIYIYQGAGVAYEGYISATSSDGFTITWTKTGSPTGTLTVYYLALR